MRLLPYGELLYQSTGSALLFMDLYPEYHVIRLRFGRSMPNNQMWESICASLGLRRLR